MPKLWLKIGPVVFGCGLQLAIIVDLLLGKGDAPGIRTLRTLAGMGLVAAVTGLITLWVARRQGTTPQARDPRLSEFGYIAAVFAVPAFIALPLLAAFYRRCLPAGVMELANRLAGPQALLLWPQAAVAATLCWFLWRTGRRDPDAPRRLRRGHSLEGSTTLSSQTSGLECANKAQDKPCADPAGGWGGMLRPSLAISLAILMAGAALGSAPLLLGSAGSAGTDNLQFLGSLYAMLPAVSALRMAHRADRLAQARKGQLSVVACVLGAIGAPAVIILPLAAAQHVACLRPLVAGLANQCDPFFCLILYWFALDWWLTSWVERRMGRPDPDAPRCPRCGYSLKGSTGLGCPECGWGRVVN